MKLIDWNKCLKCAEQACIALRQDGFNVSTSIYKMYDSKQGIRFDVLDIRGGVFKSFYSGVKESVEDMALSVNEINQRIRVI